MIPSITIASAVLGVIGFKVGKLVKYKLDKCSIKKGIYLSYKTRNMDMLDDFRHICLDFDRKHNTNKYEKIVSKLNRNRFNKIFYQQYLDKELLNENRKLRPETSFQEQVEPERIYIEVPKIVIEKEIVEVPKIIIEKEIVKVPVIVEKEKIVYIDKPIIVERETIKYVNTIEESRKAIRNKAMFNIVSQRKEKPLRRGAMI